MAQITLSRVQVKALADFCEKRGKKNFFIAKDVGAYVGASSGENDNLVYYFKGCNPKTDADWYERASDMFGGDDFGEFLPVSLLTNLIKSTEYNSLILKIGKRSISASYKV